MIRKYYGLIRLVLSLVLLGFFSASPSSSEEIVTGQETTTNYLPNISEFTRSGGTSVGTGRGCPAGEFCTSGTQGPGGTFSSTFDLQDKMSIDDINRGFSIDYSLDVKAHPSNATLESCAGGNILQSSDCRDIFRVTLSLFSAGNNLEHQFIDQIELDFSGTRNFAFQQNIPENEFTELKGGIDFFGIDAGFSSGFFGPHFSNPALTTTFDLVTFIETEILDILNNTDIISNNPITTVEVDLAPPPPAPEVVAAENEIEAEFEQQLQSMTAPQEVAPPPAEFAQTTSEDNSSNEQIEADIEEEIQEEISPQESDETREPETAEPETREARSEQEKENEEKPKIIAKKAIKEKIAKQIIKRMGSSGRYDSDNQIRTLVVMQVLAESKSFFKSPVVLQDKEGFFDNGRVPDSDISDNNFAKYVLFGGSSKQHNSMVNLQWRQ